MTKNRADRFTLGHSPDPDDAFMFYGMAENKIDLHGYRFEHRLEDIQTLNEGALRGELHISAISIHAYAYVASKYALLPCGASMGDGYGPIIVRKRSTLNVQRPAPNEDSMNDSAARELVNGKKIAVPGTMTSAFLALQLFLGELDYIVVPFDQIFGAVSSGQADVGLVIHEGKFTYATQGRKKIAKPGRHHLSEIIRESIDYGLAHREEAVRHSLPYAREMDAKLAGKFIGMYVNEFTRVYGEIGRDAIRRFLGEVHNKGYTAAPIEVEFVE